MTEWKRKWQNSDYLDEQSELINPLQKLQIDLFPSAESYNLFVSSFYFINHSNMNFFIR